MIYRFMRIIIFFDLPSVTKLDHIEYRHFIKNLKSIGFSQMQESVYTKLCLNEQVSDSTLKDLIRFLPKNGVISSLTITEKQFSSIKLLLGDIKSDVILSDEKVIKL
jgi:CRISPR-associated protein Cas2